MQKKHIWIHESKCGELYTDISLNSWFLSVRTVEPHISLETGNPWLHPALCDPDVLCSEARRKFNCAFGNGKGEKESECGYTKTICGENQPWQHYSFSVEWRYHGSCVTSVYSITAHTFLLNPITADQCCLFHSWRETIFLKVIFSPQILGPKLALFSVVRFYIGAVEDDL